MLKTTSLFCCLFLAIVVVDSFVSVTLLRTFHSLDRRNDHGRRRIDLSSSSSSSSSSSTQGGSEASGDRESTRRRVEVPRKRPSARSTKLPKETVAREQQQSSHRSRRNNNNEKGNTKSNNISNNSHVNRGRTGPLPPRAMPPRVKHSTLRENFETHIKDMRERDERGEKLAQAYIDKCLALCVANNEWDTVLEVLDVVTRQGLGAQERSTYSACLQSCFEASNGESAREILKAMELAGVEPQPADIGLVVMTLCKQNKFRKGLWRKGLDLLTKSKDKPIQKDAKPTPVEAYDAVIFCMSKEREWKESLKLLSVMEKGLVIDASIRWVRHPLPALSTYHNALEGCIRASAEEQAAQVLMGMIRRYKEKPDSAVSPNVYTFELVISGLAKRRQWRRALQLLDVMDDLNIVPNLVIYNKVIHACAKAGEVGAAMTLLVKMRRRGIAPNVVSFNSAMSACAGSARWKDALNLLDQCNREPGVSPDIVTYTTAMRACARGGNTKTAILLLDVVKDKGLKPDVYCYTAVIDACAKGKNWRKALDLLDEMRENGLQPNDFTYSVAISACGEGGQWERALELLNQMREKKISINTITYNNAITALAKAARMHARKSSKEDAMIRYSGSGEPGPLESFGGVDSDQLWVRAMELLEQMKKEGVEPDGFCYSSVISACGAGGHWKEALQLIDTMREGGAKTRPNRVAYTNAITACGRSGEWEHALELFSAMKNEGLQPDSISYNALLYALRVAHRADEAYELWQEMSGTVIPPIKTNIKSARARPGLRLPSPDIITVTDVIISLSRSEAKANLKRVDEVFADAAKRGIVLNQQTLDSLWEVDLSGMSLPVARAACRYVLQQILQAAREGATPADVHFITGVGKFQENEAVPGSSSSQGQKYNVAQRRGGRPGTALREHVRTTLRDDFDPPIFAMVPKRAQGTILIKQAMLEKWIEKQSNDVETQN